MSPWCVVRVCSWRRLLANHHSLPFPWTLSLHRPWCPSASHHLVWGGGGGVGGLDALLAAHPPLLGPSALNGNNDLSGATTHEGAFGCFAPPHPTHTHSPSALRSNGTCVRVLVRVHYSVATCAMRGGGGGDSIP